MWRDGARLACSLVSWCTPPPQTVCAPLHPLLYTQVGGVVSELLYSPAAYGLDMSVRNMPKPRARISPQASLAGRRVTRERA